LKKTVIKILDSAGLLEFSDYFYSTYIRKFHFREILSIKLINNNHEKWIWSGYPHPQPQPPDTFGLNMYCPKLLTEAVWEACRVWFMKSGSQVIVVAFGRSLRSGSTTPPYTLASRLPEALLYPDMAANFPDSNGPAETAVGPTAMMRIKARAQAAMSFFIRYPLSSIDPYDAS
jgi:hypothetical protein